MKKYLILFLLFSSVTAGLSQTQIHGWVRDTDSSAVPLASVRLPGLNTTQANEKGHFELVIPKAMAESHFLKPGVDLTIRVEKEGMVMLDPPEQDPTIRLPQNWTYQKPFEIYLARKGSLALLRSDRMLEAILRQKIQAAIEVKEQELARRDVLEEQAQLLGLDKPALLKAVGEFKDRLRTSTDLNLRGLAALDDANEATEFKIKQLKLDTAEVSFREAKRKDELAVREGEAAQKRLPEIYYNLGLTLFTKARYDSAAIYFAKADTNDADRLNMWGRALDELAQYDRALAVYHRAFVIDTTAFGRNHPKVATRLNNIAGVLRAKGDYAGALEKYEEALKIFTKFLGPDHPNTRTVAANRMQAYLESLSETERWQFLTSFYLSHLSDTLSSSNRLDLLNQIGVGYIKQAKADSALIYLNQALPLAQKLEEQEMLGSILNNLGSAHKLKKDWPQARQWLEKSLSHNRALAGDSTAVLAYTYFHLAGVAQAEGQTNLSRKYAQKSLALAELHKLAELRAEVEALLKQKR